MAGPVRPTEWNSVGFGLLMVIPICALETGYHLLGVAEVWFILRRLGDGYASLLNSFLLEFVSRLITIIFKLIPFVIGVDEARAVHRINRRSRRRIGRDACDHTKGRIVFWTLIGLISVFRRRCKFKAADRSPRCR